MNRQTDTLIGISAIGGVVTGASALVAALLSALSANWVGTGLCLLSAALAFGLIGSALLRR